MIYEEKRHIPASSVTVKHEIAACVKCNSENVTVSEYEDQYGYISTAECQSCKQKIKADATAVGVIEKWNKQNDIQLLLIAKAKLIDKTKSEIKVLKELQKQRLKVKKPKVS